jgi:hypothetical protein
MRHSKTIIVALGSFSVLSGCAPEDTPTSESTIEESSHDLRQGTVVSYPFSGTDLIARAVISANGCTATLLNDNWVITARHCVVDHTGAISGSTISVHYFPKNINANVPSSSVYLHPDPNIDVALLHLPSAISSGQGTVPLFQGEDADVVGKTVTTYGYGMVDYITGGCSSGKTCPARYFCSNNDCVLNGNVINVACTTNANCPSDYPVCDDYHHCTVSQTGSGALRKAIFTVAKVVRDGTMNSNAVYNGKYLNIPQNSSGQRLMSGDSGGPTFINGELVGITGGGDWIAYAKVFRNWVKGIVYPSTSNSISSTKNSFMYNVAPTGSQLRTGDVNNDGYVDIVQFNQDLGPKGSVYVIPGKNGGFQAETRWHTYFSVGAQIPQVADVDGDGKADIVTFDQSNGYVYVALSTGSGFGAAQSWHKSFSWAGETPRVADVNGDGRADIITFVHYNNWGAVWVSLSCGTDSSRLPAGCTGTNQFGTTRILWNSHFSLLNEVAWVGDVNNDGLADLVTFASGYAYVSLTKRHSCTSDADCGSGPGCWTALGYCPASFGEGTASDRTLWGAGYRTDLGETIMLADMNGDGFLDAVDFETVSSTRNGIVGVGLSNGSSFGSYTQWGSGFCKKGEVCVVGDINHDGKADVFDFIPAGNDYYSVVNP